MRLKNSAETFSHGIPIVWPAIRWTEVRVIYLLDTGKLASIKFPTFWCDNTVTGKIYVKHGFRAKQILCRFSFRKYETWTSPKSGNGNISKPSASWISSMIREQKELSLIKRNLKLSRLAFEKYVKGNMRLEDVSNFLAKSGIITTNRKENLTKPKRLLSFPIRSTLGYSNMVVKFTKENTSQSFQRNFLMKHRKC